MFINKIFLSSLLYLLFLSVVQAQPPQYFQNESAEYSIWWGKPFTIFPQKIIKAGSGELKSKIRKSDSSRVLIIEAYAKSSVFINAFYPVDNYSKVVVNPENLWPIFTHQIFEQKDIYRITDIDFNHQNKFLFFKDFLRKKSEVNIKIDSLTFENYPEIFDIVSALYKVRTLSLITGDTLNLDVFDTDHKVFQLKIVVIKRDTIKTIFGKNTKCVVIEPILGNYAGLFIKNGALVLWFTDDDKRVLVKAELNIKIGKVIVELAKYQNESS